MNNNYVLVKIEGKNVNNYIKWLIKNKINIINLNVIKYNELHIIIDYNDYNKLTKYSRTFKVTIIKKYGKLRLLDIIKNNFIMISSLILAIIFLFLLSNIIFSVEIIYNDQEIIKLLKNELEKYNIKKFQRKKSYKYIENVKEKILKDNLDVIEWLEIEESGTKYIIRLVERKKENKKEEYEYQSIIATKDSIIKEIKAYSGEKVKSINGYVRKGDIIVSGILTRPDGTKFYTKANGYVLGEVWYKIDIEYPLYYQEEMVTGKNKNVLSFYFLDNRIVLFPYKKYKQFRVKSDILLQGNIIPFKLAWENLYEVKVKEDIYTFDEAIDRAIDYSVDKLKKNNKNITKINNIEVLNKQYLNSKIKLSLFVSTIEDITKIIEITEDIDENEENDR